MERILTILSGVQSNLREDQEHFSLIVIQCVRLSSNDQTGSTSR